MKQTKIKTGDTGEGELTRNFIPGDEWLYYKFYTGVKTADLILAEIINPLANELLQSGLIDKWFFIRYADPKNHIRVRFHICHPDAVQKIIYSIRDLTRQFIWDDLIWKMQLDTYQREVERYGADTMETAETLFCYDSQMITEMLKILKSDEGEILKWQFALIAVDALLADFRYPLEHKFKLITRLKDGFGREFGINKSLRTQLKNKYRKVKNKINEVLDIENQQKEPLPALIQLIKIKSEQSRAAMERILKRYNNDTPDPFTLDDLFGSYSHMMINRLFKSKQRLHELVLYDFLSKYYESEIARSKYHQLNRNQRSEKNQF